MSINAAVYSHFVLGKKCKKSSKVLLDGLLEETKRMQCFESAGKLSVL